MEVWESPLWSLLDGEKDWVAWDEIRKRLPGGVEQIPAHLRAFVDAGFSLQADPKRGCRVLDRPDRLFPPWIVTGLKTNTFGKRLHYAHSMDSTQRHAIELAYGGHPEGTAVLCEYQSQGRGRRGRVWGSPPCTNILMSIVIRKPGALEESFIWTQIASLAVAEAAERAIQEQVWIKWPNDLYLRGRKLGGVLAEWTSLPEGEDSMIVGIGVNILATPPDAPKAICVRDVIPSPPSRVHLVRWILEGFEAWCNEVRSQGRSIAWEPWLRRSLILGKKVRLDEGGRSIQGRAEGFLPDGRLRLRCETGLLEEFSAGDVSVLPAEESEGAL